MREMRREMRDVVYMLATPVGQAVPIGMPRLARLDVPGVLQHVIVRGIEHRTIFADDEDRAAFVDRLKKVLQETETSCLAWALVPNTSTSCCAPAANRWLGACAGC
jgi:hypothetical protein